LLVGVEGSLLSVAVKTIAYDPVWLELGFDAVEAIAKAAIVVGELVDLFAELLDLFAPVLALADVGGGFAGAADDTAVEGGGGEAVEARQGTAVFEVIEGADC